MPPLIVLSQSLSMPGGVQKLSRKRRHEVQLRRTGDAVVALLASIGATKCSKVDISVPKLRLLDADEPLSAVAKDWARYDGAAGSEGRSTEAASCEVPAARERTLRLAAVPRGDGCARCAVTTGPLGLR